jgi:hypothetical protein
MCIIKWGGMRCLDYWSVEVVFKGKGQLFFLGGGWGGCSGWVANLLSHCCQMRVLEPSNISFKKKEKMQNKGIKKRMCRAHEGSLEMHTKF